MFKNGKKKDQKPPIQREKVKKWGLSFSKFGKSILSDSDGEIPTDPVQLDSDFEQDDVMVKNLIVKKNAWEVTEPAQKPPTPTTDSETLKDPSTILFTKSQHKSPKRVIEIQEQIENIESDTSSFEVHHEELSPNRSNFSTEKVQMLPGSPDLRFAKPPPSNPKIKHSPIVNMASSMRSSTSSPIQLADSPTNQYSRPASPSLTLYPEKTVAKESPVHSNVGVSSTVRAPNSIQSPFKQSHSIHRNSPVTQWSASPKAKLFSAIRVQSAQKPNEFLSKSINENPLKKELKTQGSQVSLPFREVFDVEKYEEAIQELDQYKMENEKLYQALQEYQERENQYVNHIKDIDAELQKRTADWQQINAIHQEMVYENEQLVLKIEELTTDYQAVSSRLEHTKKQAERQEKDFYLFSRKIATQQAMIKYQSLISEVQSENDGLKQQLRKLQYDPPMKSSDVQLREELEQAQFDVESLKLLVQDLKRENDQLKTNVPTEIDRYQFKQKMRSLEEDVESPRSVRSTSHVTSPSYQREMTREDTLSYYERKEMYEKQLRSLVEEKSKLTFELSRVPSSGIKAMQRSSELEANLDQVDRKLAQTRKQMKDLGFL